MCVKPLMYRTLQNPHIWVLCEAPRAFANPPLYRVLAKPPCMKALQVAPISVGKTTEMCVYVCSMMSLGA